MSAVLKASNQGQRKAFYDKIDVHNLSPLWEVLHGIIIKEPNSPALPYLWSWAQARPWLLESAGLISAEEAERRVLVLENPGLRGKTRITNSLYAGLQLIMPGEVAPAHRHSQSALRFVVEGRGAYTAVDGERVFMQPGDFIITPSWTFHDHGNPGTEPVIWMDGLDVAIVELFDAQFLERPAGKSQATRKTQGESLARFGNTMLPVNYKHPTHTSPLFWYPYDRSREAVATISQAQDPHPSHGWKLQYINPASGGYPMPTIATFLQLLPKGFRGKDYRATDSTAFCVVEGGGTFRCGGQDFKFSPNDVFIAPSWRHYQLHADEETVIFSFSDRPVQQALDLWREQESA
jgi:gentisate 1,2-dioxygenase